MSDSKNIFENYSPDQDDPERGNQAESPFKIAPQQGLESPFVHENEGVGKDSTNAPKSPFIAATGDLGKTSTPKIPQRKNSSSSPFQISEPRFADEQDFGFESNEAESAFGSLAPVDNPSGPESPFLSLNLKREPRQHYQSEKLQMPVAGSEPSVDGHFEAFTSNNSHQNGRSPLVEKLRTPSNASSKAEYGWMLDPQENSNGESEDFGSYLGGDRCAHSDDTELRQLELRAVFGVEDELTRQEILHRSQSLPGIVTLSELSDSEIRAIEQLNHICQRFDSTNAPLKISTGTTTIEFIRGGEAILAVQTAGAFRPGVRETLILVAKELGRLAAS